MFRLKLALLTLAGALIAAPVHQAAAQDPSVILSARRAGLIGERFDGYVGVVSAIPANVRRQVEAMNIRRRALYNNLAAKRGVGAQEVGITVGCRTLAGVQVGEYYMLGDGRWRQRLAGRPAPVPDYCGG